MDAEVPGGKSDQLVIGLLHAAMPAITGYRKAARERLEACATKDPLFWKVGAGLGQHASERYQAASVLIQTGMVWDAEIVMRSAAEAVFKLLFIALSEGDEREARIKEYTVLLSKAADLRQSERARSKLAIVSTDSPERSVFQAMILTPEEESAIRAELPRRMRLSMNAKWSFSEMIAWLDTVMAKRGSSPVTRTILHSYGISSHVMHADERGLALIQERMSRPDEERTALHHAHAARLLSDMIAFYALTVLAYESVARLGNTKLLEEAVRAEPGFQVESRRVLSAFYASQAELYRRMGFPYPDEKASS